MKFDLFFFNSFVLLLVLFGVFYDSIITFQYSFFYDSCCWAITYTKQNAGSVHFFLAILKFENSKFINPNPKIVLSCFETKGELRIAIRMVYNLTVNL